MPFLFDVHMTLKLGETGAVDLERARDRLEYRLLHRFLSHVARSLAVRFWKRWKPAWLVKWRAGYFRLNFDLHRAGGLWFWLVLFIFAWSSVNLVDSVRGLRQGDGGYLPFSVTHRGDRKVLPEPPSRVSQAGLARGPGRRGKVDGRAAKAEGFKVVRPVSLNYFSGSGLYNYIAETDRVFPTTTEWSSSSTRRPVPFMRT